MFIRIAEVLRGIEIHHIVYGTEGDLVVQSDNFITFEFDFPCIRLQAQQNRQTWYRCF